MIEAIQVLLMFAYANLVWAAWATWGRASAARFCARGATPPHRHGLVWHGVCVCARRMVVCHFSVDL